MSAIARDSGAGAYSNTDDTFSIFMGSQSTVT